MSNQLPAYTVKIGWETAVAGTVRFDVSKFNGVDVFANAFTNFFTNALDDVTGDVATDQATIARGRNALIGPIGAGTFDFVLSKPSDPTLYDPNNPASPIAALSPGFVPLRPVTVTATVDGGPSVPRFYGFIRTANYDPITRQCTVHAEDLLLWLSRLKVTTPTLAPTTTQAVIGAILDACGWNDLSLRVLSSYGDSIPTYTADGTQFALALLDALVTAERGLYYIDAAGRFVYEDKNARSRRTSVKAVFTDMQLAVDGDATSGIDLDALVNQVTVTDASGIPVTVNNLPSQQSYGIGAGDDVNSTLIPSGTGADLAKWEAALYGSLRSPITGTFDNSALPFLFNLDLQDRIRVIDTLTNRNADYFIERIEENFGEGSLYMSSKLTLSKRGLGGFVFDYSPFDGADVFVTA